MKITIFVQRMFNHPQIFFLSILPTMNICNNVKVITLFDQYFGEALYDVDWITMGSITGMEY